MTNKQRTAAWILAFVVAIVAAFAIYTVLSNRQTAPSNLNTSISQDSEGDSQTPTPAPDFTVIDENGNEVTLAQFKGKPVVVNFWASWCPPCKEEMPAFNAAYSDMGNEVVFLMVNATDGQRETQESAMAYVDENNYIFPVYFDTTGDAATKMGVTGYPETYFIDAGGNIVAKAEGALSESDLMAGLKMISLD